ncbi:DUF4912 domain-containing protein [Bacillus sp. DJP31]|uniref:DUF4912 domain-containing protein n=1 Tax=Bacillus sp. DJP31 TaxID=3409789 RepID=UPI003BB714D6
MIQEIINLRNEGLSFREIAKEMETTVGKIHYRWSKHIKETEGNNEDQHEMEDQPHKLSQYLDKPSSYNLDMMCAMVKNATTIYTYWELSSIKKSFLEHHFGQEWSFLPKFLKVYDVTSLVFNGQNAHFECEIPLPEMINNWFITELEPNRTYIADLGIKTDQGAFFTILRSNSIETPRNSPNQVGMFSENVYKWKTGLVSSPSWLENFSTYSYYEKIK